METYYITGVQLGLLSHLLINDKKEGFEMIKEIIETQQINDECRTHSK